MQFQDLLAYKKSFALAMKIFHISKSFPKEEKYSLTDQITFNDFIKDSEEVGKLLNYMINNPSKFGSN